ncbi:MAG: hypothetical protein AAGF01_09685 [Cyanobacteria bacterium P01_G01_bin.38]
MKWWHVFLSFTISICLGLSLSTKSPATTVGPGTFGLSCTNLYNGRVAQINWVLDGYTRLISRVKVKTFQREGTPVILDFPVQGNGNNTIERNSDDVAFPLTIEPRAYRVETRPDSYATYVNSGIDIPIPLTTTTCFVSCDVTKGGGAACNAPSPLPGGGIDLPFGESGKVYEISGEYTAMQKTDGVSRAYGAPPFHERTVSFRRRVNGPVKAIELRDRFDGTLNGSPYSSDSAGVYIKHGETPVGSLFGGGTVTEAYLTYNFLEPSAVRIDSLRIEVD